MEKATVLFQTFWRPFMVYLPSRVVHKKYHSRSLISEQCKRAIFKLPYCQCYYCRPRIREIYICTGSWNCFKYTTFDSFKRLSKHLRSHHNYRLPRHKPGKASELAKNYYIRIEIELAEKWNLFLRRF